MKNSNKDILRDNPSLKEMPFSTPEGYFSGLKEELNTIRSTSSNGWKRTISYVALAAMFALLVAAGGFFLEKQTEENYTQEDYIVFSEDMTNTIFYGTDDQYADALTDDDIIEYLIYTGIDIDELY